MAKVYSSPEEELKAIEKKQARLDKQIAETEAALAKCRKRMAELKQMDKK